MKISEKSLELNLGAEILNYLRCRPGFDKAYLRGLTQREEKSEGVDFFAQLPAGTRIFAFQFKAPKGKIDAEPFRFTIKRYQHDLLFSLASGNPGSVFYVFPFYATPRKLHDDLPTLSNDTWLCDIQQMNTAATFNYYESRTVKCRAGIATINPEYGTSRLSETSFGADFGIDSQAFQDWYYRFRQSDESQRRNSWLSRALRIGIAIP